MRQHRHHGHQGRFPRRHQPHVLRRQTGIQAERLAEVAYEACGSASRSWRPGKHLGDIGARHPEHVESNRFSVVREYCGHGIGRRFHEDPQVLHYGKPGTGLELRPA